jgi:hypothetical protein
MNEVKTLYLDWDVNYKTYLTTTKWEAFQKWFPEIVSNYGDCQAYVRQSANGKVHIRLDFSKNIPLFDSMIIRALLADDVFRLIMDLKRCFRNPEETNRIFEQKWSNGSMKKAGEWTKLPIMTAKS